ncbi:MAG: sigma-70 family RNA polymerase sigma factor [Bacteroidota bacterium]
MRDTDDQQLLAQVRSGDARAFAALYERYKARLYGFCVRLLADDSLAQDAVQETFLKLRHEAGHITEPRALRSWLYRVARNEALMLLRGRRNGNTADPDLIPDSETPQMALERKDVGEALRTALAALKTEYREVIVLRELDGLSYAEIAEITGDTESSVKSRLFKARRALAERLAPWWDERERP